MDLGVCYLFRSPICGPKLQRQSTRHSDAEIHWAQVSNLHCAGIFIDGSFRVLDGIIIDESLRVLGGIIIDGSFRVLDGIIIDGSLRVLDGIIIDGSLRVLDICRWPRAATVGSTRQHSRKLGPWCERHWEHGACRPGTQWKQRLGAYSTVCEQ